jgi:hypothetical protein
MKRGERKKQKKKKIKDPICIPNLWWQHHKYYWKTLDEISPTTQKKVTNGEWSRPHESFKYVGAHLPLDARVTYFGHCLWLSLVLLDSLCWYLSNNTDNIIIGVSVCLWSFFFSFFSPSLSSLYLILCLSNFTI